MSPKVKIAMAAINIACLAITLLSPTTITPLILLTTIASTVSWAFTTQERTPLHHSGLYWYIGGAALLSVICIVLGITASISYDPPGKYQFVFDSTIAGLGDFKFGYPFFAWSMFSSISVLMAIEIYVSITMENSKADSNAKNLPIAQRINQQLSSMP